MDELNPTAPPQPPELPKPLPAEALAKVGSKPLPKWAFPLGLIVLAIAAFLVGSKLASSDKASYILTPSGNGDATSTPIQSVPVTELPDGKGEEVVDAVPPQPLPPFVETYVEPTEIPLHPDLAAQFAIPSTDDEGSTAGAAYAVGDVTVAGKTYQLQLHELTYLGMGTSTTTYYVLANPQGANDYLLTDKMLISGTFSSLHGFQPTTGSIDEVKEGPTRLKLVKGWNVPALNSPSYVLPKDGTKAFSVGIGARAIKEALASMSAESDCTRRTDAWPFCSHGSGLFWKLRADAHIEWYQLDIPFRLTEKVEYAKPFVPAIVWNDGSKNTAEYLQAGVGGCGVSSPLNMMTHPEEIAALGELTPAGTFRVGGKTGTLYEALSYTDATLDWTVTSLVETDPSMTREKFMASRPYFFWEDSLGRLLKFTSGSAVPLAECGKPVIYLYPEKTTALSVNLDPKGGFTKSEPAYGNGWNVVAQPDGTLTNKADGKTYPYLFWEGRGGLYTSPENFWVVKQSDVHNFLVDTLAKLGLNKKETADFMEFWEPRMQAAPYYRIGFHGTQVMNQLAPLSISETPDTLVRILMDYHELQEPVVANTPRLGKTPVRNGFTVIEWGGVLR